MNEPQIVIIPAASVENLKNQQNYNQVSNIKIITGTNNQPHDTEFSPVIIPPEAQLSEIQIDDIQNLVQGEQKLYFYVSPLKLNLPRK